MTYTILDDLGGMDVPQDQFDKLVAAGLIYRCPDCDKECPTEADEANPEFGGFCHLTPGKTWEEVERVIATKEP